MSEQEKWQYLQDAADYELDRMERDERQDCEDFVEWAAAQADFERNLGVEQCHRLH